MNLSGSRLHAGLTSDAAGGGQVEVHGHLSDYQHTGLTRAMLTHLRAIERTIRCGAGTAFSQGPREGPGPGVRAAVSIAALSTVTPP